MSCGLLVVLQAHGQWQRQRQQLQWLQFQIQIAEREQCVLGVQCHIEQQLSTQRGLG